MIAPKRLLHRLALTPFMLTALAGTVLAGPEGNYQVSGTNIGDGSPYTGTVEVVRNGKTYSVRWEIAGATFVGSGLGAAAVKGTTVVGPADTNDYVLAVGYAAANHGFGIAYYVEQEDGSWKGIWTYAGSDNIGTEVWTPR